MPIEAVIFDLGGVLVRTEDRSSRQLLAESMGLSYEDLDRAVFSSESFRRAQLGEISVDRHWQIVFEDLGVPLQDRERFKAHFWGGDRLDVQLVDYIRTLRSRYRTALLSNYSSDLRTLLTNVWRIEDAFDEIFISAELGMMKPDKKIFQYVVKRLGVPVQKVVFVDDFPVNVTGARDAGLRAVQFRSRPQTIEELNALLENGDRT